MNQYEAIADLIIHAYNVGLMQDHHLTVCGLTATLKICASSNILTLDTYNRTLSVHIYDSDNVELREESIRALVVDMFN